MRKEIPKSIKLSERFHATYLTEDIAPAMGNFVYETWVVREEDGTPYRQVQIYREKGKWHPWTMSMWMPSEKNLVRRLAELRNRREARRRR